MRHSVRLLAFTALLLVAGTAGAQQRMFAVTTDTMNSALWEARIDGGVLSGVRLVGSVGGAALGVPVVTAGGQFVVWPVAIVGGSALAVVERESGATQVLAGAGSLHVSDPTGLRLFVQLQNQIASLTAAGTTVIPNTDGLIAASISPDGRRLYAIRTTQQGSTTVSDLVGIDTNAGTVLGTLPLGPGLPLVMPHPDDESVWVLSNPLVTPPRPLLRRLALPSGAELLAVPLPAGSPVTTAHRVIGVDPALRRIAVSTTWLAFPWGTPSPAEIGILDTESGAERARIATAGLATDVLDSGTGTILSFSQLTAPPPSQTCGTGTLRTISLASGALLSSTAVDTTACLRVAFAAPPPPPTLNAAVVSLGRSVTLSWTRAPQLTTAFTVEAGSGPGRADLATFQAGSSSLTVPSVPPGTYYVRVRAQNYVGASAASNEIVVTVQ